MYNHVLKIITAAAFFLSVSAAHASTSDVSIRLSQPKSPTKQTSINITFVTLDTQDRAITVKCFKKGPADGAFSQFGPDINLAPGGNTGNCQADSAVLTSAGSYQFQASAAAGADEVSSNVVSVDFNNSSGPGTPTNYSKEKPSSCIYRIKFKTADDAGKTTKVEVYRSENTSFNADSGTRVATISIGSNTEGSADITSPDCAKEYFFAIRAFDNVGNGSGVTGDSITVVTTSSTSTLAQSQQQTSQGAIFAAGSSQVGQGGSVLGEATETETDGQVEATQDSQPQSSPKVSPSPEPEDGPSIFSLKNVVIGGVLILALFALVFLFLKPKNT
jgi:hypothetical protein